MSGSPAAFEAFQTSAIPQVVGQGLSGPAGVSDRRCLRSQLARRTVKDTPLNS